MRKNAYVTSEHFKKVVAATPGATMAKHCGTIYMGRTQIKNAIIQRHLFDRLVQTCGPFDGRRGANNYKRSGMPINLRWGGPETPFDVHMLAWQMELVDAGLIELGEILSPASICMIMKWAITAQQADEVWKTSRIVGNRRHAIAAGWLLALDVIELEKLNFDNGVAYKLPTKNDVEKDGADELEAEDDV
jgi:hypothetical protein